MTLLFDYGGTLDTGGNHWGCVIWNVYSRLLPEIDYAKYREVYVETERWLGREPIISELTTFKEVLRIKINHHFHLLSENDPCLQSILSEEKQEEVLDKLYSIVLSETAKSHRVISSLSKTTDIALVSNFYGNLSTVLQEFHLQDLFPVVVESAKVGLRKPDEKIFEYALQRLGCKNEKAVVIGDSMKNDIRPAKRIGCTTVWIKGQTWQEQTDEANEADYIINDIAELAEIDFEAK